jgi:hypothetical protein
MKKILTTLLLVFSLSGVMVAAEPGDSASRTEAKNSATGHTLHAALLQRRYRRRWRRRWHRRMVRVHWNNGRRVGRRWNNRRWNNRRWNRRGRRGGHQM